MPVKQPSCPLYAVAAHQQVTAVGIPHERGHACLINADVNRIKPAEGFIGNLARLFFAADPHICAKPQKAGKPRDKQYRGNGPCQFQDFCGQEARPRSMSIIAVTGDRS